MITELKQYIKELAEGQKSLKQDRKTGTLPAFPRDRWGYVNHDAVPAHVKKSWAAANQVQRNKVRITAALNLYHELRGTGLSHGFDSEQNAWYWCYDKIYQELKEQFVPQEV